MRLIVQEAKGIPRRLNILCDNAFVTAYGYKKSLVTASTVKEVVSDLTGQRSHSLWKLVPLAAGALVLLLALVSLLPLTQSQSWDSGPLQEIGQLIDPRDNLDQEPMNVDKRTNLSDPGGHTLVEKAQDLLAAFVPEVLEELQELIFSESDSTTTSPNLQPDIDRHIQEKVILAMEALPDPKDSASVVSEESKNLAVSSNQRGAIIAERARNWLAESAPEALEELQGSSHF